MTIVRTYKELITYPTFEERFEYLRLNGIVGKDTFGFDRVFNQMFYHSKEWKRVRNLVIARDTGNKDFCCDLGIDGRPIYDRILIHHMNPIDIDDIRDASDYLLNPDFLISTTFNTHRAIHYGDVDLLNRDPIERVRNDTCPWKH